MEPLLDRLELVEKHITRAVAAAEGDAHVSPITRAVLLEFQRKMKKARDSLSASSLPRDRRDAVIEVEQAADSAVVAVTADEGAENDTRKAVELAHKAICLLKFEGGFEA